MDPIFRHGHIARADDGDTETLRVVLANEGRMADGLDLQMDGADLARFEANPVLGYGHSYWGRGNLPIGRVSNVEIDGGRMAGDLEFDQGDEFAVQVERKIRDGFLSAVSIGFDPRQVDDDGVVTDWELFEVSVVPIPMDPGALVEAGRASARALRADLLDLASKLDGDTDAIITINRFTPESAVAAVDQQDMTLLEHTGLSSVQQLRAPDSLSERMNTGRATEAVAGGAGGDASNTPTPQARDRVLKLSGVIP